MVGEANKLNDKINKDQMVVVDIIKIYPDSLSGQKQF
jgi:hypothetical protein